VMPENASQPEHEHDFRYSHAEPVYGSTSDTMDVTVCRTCGAVMRARRGAISGY
jgi:hypothetical protein